MPDVPSTHRPGRPRGARRSEEASESSSDRPRPTATLVLKASERCNSNCYYCHLVRKAGALDSMSHDVLRAVFARADEYLQDDPSRILDVLWHGGEPLLPGPELYEEACRLQTECCPDTAPRIRHSIQTNLTLFTDAFADVLRRLGITSLGTSYDPEPHVRGPGAEVDTQAYNRAWMRGRRIAERHGFSWALVYVVTRRNLDRPLDTFHFLTNLHLRGGFRFEPVVVADETRRDVAITPDEYADFLSAVFPDWWKHRDRYPMVEPFRSLLRTLTREGRYLTCANSGDCSYEYVVVGPDGETSQCSRSAYWDLLSYGNIRDRSLAEILADERRDELAERQRILREGECRHCRLWGICHGGCPVDARSTHGDFLHASEWCRALRAFVARCVEPLTGHIYQDGGDAD